SQSLAFDSREWQAARTLLAAGGSVVVMMGLARAATIAEWLIANGCRADLPAAAISRGTWPSQQSRYGTLSTIFSYANELGSPAILVLGSSAKSILPATVQSDTNCVLRMA